MNTNTRLGSMRVKEAVASGENIAHALAKLFGLGVHSVTLEACAQLGAYVQAARSAGIAIPCNDPGMKQFIGLPPIAMAMALSEAIDTDGNLAGRQAVELIYIVSNLRASGVTWSAAETVKSEPVDVRIIESRARITKTTVVRDAETQEIVSTTQIEQDMNPEVPQPQDCVLSK